MAELNKKLYAVIKGEQRQLIRLEEVKNGVKVGLTDLAAVIKGVKREIVDNVLYRWGRYSAISHSNYVLFVPSLEEPLEEIDGMDYDDIEEDYGEADEHWVNDEIGGNYKAWYKTISIDGSGNIVGGTSASCNNAKYVREGAGGEYTWYYIADTENLGSYMGYISGDMYVFEIEAKEIITYSQGDFIENVTTSDQTAFPEIGEKDGFWYVYLGEVENNA